MGGTTQPSMFRVPLARQSTGFSEAASVVSSRATIPAAAHSPSTPIERPASLAGSVANGLAGVRARPAASSVLSRSQSTAASAYGPDDVEAERVYRALQGQRVEAPEPASAPVRSGQAVNGRATERNHSPSGWSTSTVEASEPAPAPVRSGHAVNGRATERNRSPSGWSTSTRPLQGQRVEAPAPEPQPVRLGHAVNGRATEPSHPPSGWSTSTYGIPMPAPVRIRSSTVTVVVLTDSNLSPGEDSVSTASEIHASAGSACPGSRAHAGPRTSKARQSR